jgi:hypothetical protein
VKHVTRTFWCSRERGDSIAKGNAPAIGAEGREWAGKGAEMSKVRVGK